MLLRRIMSQKRFGSFGIPIEINKASSDQERAQSVYYTDTSWWWICRDEPPCRALLSCHLPLLPHGTASAATLATTYQPIGPPSDEAFPCMKRSKVLPPGKRQTDAQGRAGKPEQPGRHAKTLAHSCKPPKAVGGAGHKAKATVPTDTLTDSMQVQRFLSAPSCFKERPHCGRGLYHH